VTLLVAIVPSICGCDLPERRAVRPHARCQERSTTGLKVRFFRVKIPADRRGVEISTGNAVRAYRAAFSRMMELANVVM